MNRFHGTSARQLDLDLPDAAPAPRKARPEPVETRTTLRLLRRDVYAELARRRRRAQIEARHLLERE